MPEPSEPADATATTLQSLALEKKPEEQQQAGPDTRTALQATAEQSSSGNISLDHRQEEVASDLPEGTVRLCLYCIVQKLLVSDIYWHKTCMFQNCAGPVWIQNKICTVM